MRFERWIFGLALLGFLAAPAVATADDVGDGDVQEQLWLMQQKLKKMEDQLAQQDRTMQAAGVQPTAAPADCFFCSIEVDGWISATYFYNFENSDGRDNGGFNQGSIAAYPFHPDDNSFSVDQVWIGLERPVSESRRAGFRLDFVYGKTAGLLSGDFGAGDGLSGNDFELYQAYIQYLAPVMDGIEFKFGKFATVIGAEVVQSPANFNITRGHVYNLFQPITHMGILASLAPWDGGSFSFGVVNETRSFPASDIDLNNNKAILWSVGHEFSESLSMSFNGAHGASDSGQGQDTKAGDKETIIDFILSYNPTEDIETYVNADYIWSENENFGESDYSGFGIAAAGRYHLNEDLSFALRTEYVDLDTGAGPDDDLDLWSLTGTVAYNLTPDLTIRGELRWDKQDGSDPDDVFFDSRNSVRGVPRSGQVVTEDDQVTAGVEVLYTF